MSFDPTLPVTNSPLSSAEMRAQLTALKAPIDAQGSVAYGRLGSDWTSGTSSFSDVPGLSFSVASGENWTAEIVLHAVSSSAGQGFKFRVAGPGAGSVFIAIQRTGSSGSTAIECEVQTAFSVASPAKSFCVGASLIGVVRIHLVVINASAGTVQLQANNSGGSNTVTLKANSDLVARRTGLASDMAAAHSLSLDPSFRFFGDPPSFGSVRHLVDVAAAGKVAVNLRLDIAQPLQSAD